MADQINKVDLRHSLDRLYDVIASRKDESPEDSYTAQLFVNAPENPARKLCEEATEVLIEALNHNKVKLTAESADLLYHLIVSWIYLDINPKNIWDELKQREVNVEINKKRKTPNGL